LEYKQKTALESGFEFCGFATRSLGEGWSCWDGSLRTEIMKIGREIEEVKRFIGLKNGQTPV